MFADTKAVQWFEQVVERCIQPDIACRDKLVGILVAEARLLEFYIEVDILSRLSEELGQDLFESHRPGWRVS